MAYNAKALIKAALNARARAYVPYSHFAVGAALQAQDGTVYEGGNIENAAYSVCNCAERTALFKAVSEGHRSFEAIAVVGAAEGISAKELLPLCAPCGVCRQALFEFGGNNLEVILAQSEEVYTVYTLGQLLVEGFGPHNLEK